MMSENVWCFVSCNVFSQDTLLYSAAEPAQSFSAMQGKCNFVALAEELWRGTGKSRRGFSTWGGRLRDCGRDGVISPSSLPSRTCSSYMDTFLPCFVRAASHSNLLTSDVSLCFGSWDTGSHRSRRGGGKAGLRERWKLLWMQWVPLEANWGGGGFQR